VREVASPPSTSQVTPTPPTPPAATGPQRQADDVVARALVEASRIRELPATGPVSGVVLTRPEIGANVQKSVERELPPDVLNAEGETLIGLGVVPPTFDYVKAIVSLMTAELAGYYEPSDKTMYLAADLGAAEREATLSHELVHALQDQHYDLGRLLDYRDDASDEQSADHALAEGDATSAMLDAMLEPRGQKATDLPETLLSIQVRAAAELTGRDGDVPGILKRSLVAPYVDGVEFVHALRRRGGWAEVDRVWEHPPKSTAQLLHPEKLAAKTQPIVVSIPVAPADGPKNVLYHDVFGEQSLRILFEEWVPRKVAVDAANHWAGDRIAVFRDGDRVAVALRVRYDDAASAAKGEHAFRRGLAAEAVEFRSASPESGKAPPASDAAGAQRQASQGLGCALRDATGPIAVARRGHDVAVVAGPYSKSGGAPIPLTSCTTASAWALRVLGAS
jgi:hypothetical protein